MTEVLPIAAIRRDGGTQTRAQVRAEAKRLRADVIRAFHGRCAVCSFDIADVLVVHHVVRVADGGQNRPDALIAVCPTCHALLHELHRRMFFKDGGDTDGFLRAHRRFSEFLKSLNTRFGERAAGQMIDWAQRANREARRG